MTIARQLNNSRYKGDIVTYSEERESQFCCTKFCMLRIFWVDE